MVLKKRWFRWVLIAVAIAGLVVGLRACFAGNELADTPQEEIAAELTLQDVTLEQPDEDGTLLWRLTAKSVTYVPDTQRAELLELDGEFFQAGEVVYTVKADEGEVLQNGNTLYLRGNLVATGREDELTLEGEQLKWEPKKDLLVMGEFEDASFEPFESPDDEAANPTDNPTDNEAMPSAEEDDAQETNAQDTNAQETNAQETISAPLPPALEDAPVRGFNPQLKVVARLVEVNNTQNRVELTGGVFAQSKESPWLTFNSNSLLWFTKREIIEANQPLTVEQFENDAYQTVTDRVVGAKGQVELAENRVTLNESVQVDVLSQPLTVRSEQAIWEVDDQTVLMNKPVNINQPERQVTAVANQARLDLAEQIVYLIGDVRAVGEQNDARLTADRVTWQTQTQQVEAEGNVSYQQAADPDISISGPRAVGDIEAGTVVIEGGESGEVVTEIVPDGF